MGTTMIAGFKLRIVGADKSIIVARILGIRSVHKLLDGCIEMIWQTGRDVKDLLIKQDADKEANRLAGSYKICRSSMDHAELVALIQSTAQASPKSELPRLSLFNNGIGDAGAIALAEALPQSKVKELWVG